MIAIRLKQKNRQDLKSDVELTHRVANGDAHAKRQLVDRLLDRVALTVRYLAASDSDMDDYVQLSIIEILQSVGSYRGESTLEVWADRISVRTVMRQIKKRRWRQGFVTLDTAEQGRVEASFENEVNRKRVFSRLLEVMGTLTKERRLVVTLRLVLGHSIQEIAEMTQTSHHTVRDRLYVGRRQLRGKILRDPLLKEQIVFKNEER